MDGIDVVLLGPQIAYKLSTVKPKCDQLGIACGVIPMIDFGMMNGDKILNSALNLNKEMKERLEREEIEREMAEIEAAERE